MSDQLTSERLLIYASEQYLLPADKVESRRLDAQHKFITTLFEGKLSTAPTNLTTGDRVLESAAGTGIWALEFFEENRADGVILDIECIDMSSAQFPANHPPQLHFSIHSIAKLPNPDWSDIFAYAHQRLLLFAMNESLWRLAVTELFRVIRPGGWVELVEIDLDLDGWSVLGPDTARLMSLGTALFDAKGVIGDLSVYLPGTLKDAGFVEVRCEPRRVLIGGEAIHVHEFPTALTYSSELWRAVWMGMKGPVVDAGGYGIIETVEEYEALVEASARECRFASKQRYINFHTSVA